MNRPPPDVPQAQTPAPTSGRATEIARKTERLKAALKANMARRKAQGRARAAENDNEDE